MRYQVCSHHSSYLRNVNGQLQRVHQTKASKGCDWLDQQPDRASSKWNRVQCARRVHARIACGTRIPNTCQPGTVSLKFIWKRNQNNVTSIAFPLRPLLLASAAKGSYSRCGTRRRLGWNQTMRHDVCSPRCRRWPSWCLSYPSNAASLCAESSASACPSSIFSSTLQTTQYPVAIGSLKN